MMNMELLPHLLFLQDDSMNSGNPGIDTMT